MTRHRFVIAGLVALLAGSVSGSGQTPAQTTQTPTFQSQVTYVEVDAIVTDQQGRFVRDLTKADFQVSEDGRPQSIDTFSLVDIPVDVSASSAHAAIEHDVATNLQPFDGRVYVLVMDAAHTDFARTPKIQAAARQFVQQYLGARDLMAIVHIGGQTEAGQDFTSNKRLLLASIDRFEGRKLTPAAVVKQEADEAGTVTSPNGQPLRLFENYNLENERAAQALSMLRELRAVADWFGGVRGRRKAIVMLSEGIDYDFENLFDQHAASAVIQGQRDAVAAIMRANVSIYPLDPSGLIPASEHDIGQAASIHDALENERRRARNSLRYLAENTGGFALVNSNTFSAAFERVVAENSSYYLLAYYPSAEKRTGAFHNIQVKVNRPGLVVRARSGYAAPPAGGASISLVAPSGLSRDLLEVMRSPMPISGLTIGMFAAPFKGQSSDASVLLGIELRGRDLKLQPDEAVEVSYAAIDNTPKIRASQTFSFKLTLPSDTLAKAEQTGLRVLRRMDLPPGRYQLRVGAHEALGGASGSVVTDLEVPDFTKTPLAMSGILLTSPSASRQPTIARDDRTEGAVLPAPPAALRIFPDTDELALFVEIYDNDAAPHTVDVSTTVVADDGTVVFEAQDKRSKDDFGTDHTYRHSARLPLKDFDAGSYVLKVEARSRLAAETAVSRQVPFQVVER